MSLYHMKFGQGYNHNSLKVYGRVVYRAALYSLNQRSKALVVRRSSCDSSNQKRSQNFIVKAAKGFGTPVRTQVKEERKNLTEICDKLIQVFQSQPQGEWRKLISFSKKWSELADHVFARLYVLKKQVEEEGDTDAIMRYTIMIRELQNLHKSVQRHSKIVQKKGTQTRLCDTLL
eukprot:TRINITY_DN5793_c0_g1_i5.p2 TRINITY_DN5793_c0_g1~~TRINITY_DN5793_c0_g1_i5.p2  ORF type:complete len:175 (-),score=5.43 TRINITY_DN5793_c0_g1_i5:34-558(-)